MEYINLPRSLPSEEQFDRLVNKYKDFRLFSMAQSPGSFGSTLAREESFPRETWVSRVTNPLATNLVAVVRPPGLDSPPLEGKLELTLEQPWLASLTLVGPLDPAKAEEMYGKAMHIAPGMASFGPPEEATGIKWQFALNAMYVVPEGRGRGLAKGIVKSAVQLAVSMGEGQGARVVLLVDYDNEAARAVYKSSGFEVTHRYWFDDHRVGRSGQTEAAVMKLDTNGLCSR
ncbi:hypothetical protein HYQ45_008384 [Verticillium longisporum]|uniref:N-acetyltransferase domain-containing protein n=1 Tax=Verticillium longisporum TaxID=100787 RepID=A0A8I2ZMA3_VERLO|nr:hypothetical protein HYQ45_008384 [Verticillium longisporum]